MMTATKEDLSICKVTLHKVNTHISGIGMPSKKRKTYASKQTFFYQCVTIFFVTMYIFEAPEQFLYCKKVVKLATPPDLAQ